jgi:hypothetical protein
VKRRDQMMVRAILIILENMTVNMGKEIRRKRKRDMEIHSKRKMMLMRQILKVSTQLIQVIIIYAYIQN